MKETKAQPPSAEHKDTRGHHSMFGRPYYSQTMPTTSSADPHRVAQPPTNRQHDTRTSQKASRHMFFHYDTPLWSCWQSPITRIVRQILFNLQQNQHCHQDSHHRTHRNFITLQAKNPNAITHTNQNYNHLHRRFLLRWSEDLEKQRLHRRRRCAQLWFRLHKWMGGSSFPTRQDPNSYPRGSALEDPTTLHQQSRIHILPRSLGSHRHTSSSQTPTHTPIHTTMRQRSRDTRDKQGIW